MDSAPDPHGILYPARLPSIERHFPGTHVKELLSWFWLVDWDILPGRTSRQDLLPFPQMNLVVQPEGVTLSGPASGASHRDLSGTSWAVGALLLPAAAQGLSVDPSQLLDQVVRFDARQLLSAISKIKTESNHQSPGTACVKVFSSWISATLPSATSAGHQADELLDAVATDRGIVKVSQLAQRLSLSTRSVQRISERHLGMSPLALIRHYRLQEAAYWLREDPAASIAGIAATLGYTDQAHLAADFQKVLGYSPSAYCKGSG